MSETGVRSGTGSWLDRWVYSSVLLFRHSPDHYRRAIAGATILGAAIGAFGTLAVVIFVWLVLR